MDIAEKAHRQKSVKLETIEIKMGGELNLKLFAYPIKKQIYSDRLAFVVYYEYKTLHGYYNNWSSRSGFEPRFWINKDQDIESLAQSGKLILKSHSYQDLRLKIIQMAIFDSASEDSLNTSKNNIKWVKDHPNDFSKRRIGTNDFARDKKRLETVPQPKIVNVDKITKIKFIDSKPEAKKVRIIKKRLSKISELKQFIKIKGHHLKVA